MTQLPRWAHSAALACLLSLIPACKGIDPGDSDPQQPDLDQDGDGAPASTDCDDSDPSVYPDAPELCNGVDDNCDGQTDGPDATDAPTWYTDQDGDTYGDPSSPLVACEAPAEALAQAGDCDDSDPTLHPDAPELCNGLDDNCDGQTDGPDATDAPTWYTDKDGDTYGDIDSPLVACQLPKNSSADPSDCDDSNPAVYPHALDACEDGLDQDCDGADAGCGGLFGEVDPDSTYTTVYYANDVSTNLASCFQVAEWNGDGQMDLLLSAPQADDPVNNAGRVYVIPGPLPPGAWPEVTHATVVLYGLAGSAYAGGGVRPVGDLDGDGDDEVYISTSGYSGSSGSGVEQGLVLGDSVSGELALKDAILYNMRCVGPRPGGDHDGDGTPGWVCSDGGSELPWYEGLDAEPSMEITGNTHSYFGLDAVLNQDLDGDGTPDLWIGATRETVDYASEGAAYFFSGPFATQTSADADAKAYGTARYQEMGIMVQVADLNGDGTLDPMAGSFYADYGANNAGGWWGWLGPLHSDRSSDDADLKVYGVAENTELGRTPGVGDFDGDGFDDLAFASNKAPGGGDSRGELWLFYGPHSGTLDLHDAATVGMHLQGDTDYDYVGAYVFINSDLSGDGRPDLLFGAHGKEWGSSGNYGMWYMLSGE